ncbi:MAG: hypothetical protein NWR21_01890, partial [Verrucomicrobiales bacterium]|nr:hypothetical protein [Verrucomicrobiales bacterium]
MSDSSNKCCSKPKLVLGTLGIFVIFGFLALILSGYAGNESLEDRAYMGDFTPEVTAQRWANLEEIEKAQGALVDQAKVDAALAALVSAAPKAEATAIVVPGSPTFLKQMEQPAAPAAAAAPAPATPAPAPATPAPA